jgi:ankyrin repeat protein
MNSAICSCTEGCTPLHLAVVQSHPATITILLGVGASPHAQDDDGYTPASEAADIGDPAVLAALGLLHFPAPAAT